MRVGILTLFHGNNNWGGDLQGYALKAYIEDNFKDTHVDLIKYRSGVNVIYKSKFEQMEQYGPSEVIKKISERIVKRKTPADGLLKKRNELFEQFQKCYLTNDHVYTDEELSELAKEYDCLICGSDQIWNPNVARPGYFLKGVEGTRKVSYAASIARDRLSDKEADAMIPLIEKFDFISVREKTAKKILDGYLKGKKSVYEVLDPALMRTREQWSEFIGTERYETEPYALMFFFSDSSAYRSRIEAYCHNHGLKLIGIPHATTYIKSDETGNYEKAYDIGPVEFLRLFRDASYVFTDSFHGSAFSIIFQRQFCVFERDKNTKTLLNVFKDAGGVWHEDRFRPLISALVNLSLNLAAVKYIGIYGIVLSTIVALGMIEVPWLLRNIFTVMYDSSLFNDYFKMFVSWIVATVFSCASITVLTYKVTLSGWGAFAFFVVVSVLIPNIVFLLLMHRKEEFKLSISMVNRITHNKLPIIKNL